VTASLAAPRRRVSLVDWASFELMRRRGIERAFAFDRDFSTQGFEIVPRN
jgi:predicted nucleic acid-binding protein